MDVCQYIYYLSVFTILLALTTPFSAYDAKAKDFEYAVCVPRQEFHQAPDHFSWAWYTPTLEDFGTILAADHDDVPGKLKQEQSLGLLSLLNIAQGHYNTCKKTWENKKDMVPRLLLTLRHSIYKLMQEPLPCRDIVALIARPNDSS